MLQHAVLVVAAGL